MAVVHLVAALVTAYRDGADLVLALRERRWARGQAQHFPAEQQMLDDLEMVMARGSDVVQNQYERHNRRLGEAFATGDQIARDAMNNLVIHLQKRLMSRLKIAWQQDTHVDPHPLLEIAEDVQDRAIMCLMQLNQRLSAQEPSSIMERSRPKLKKHKTTSSLHQHPYDTGAIPGAPEGFIDAHPPVPSHSNLFGYHVEISGPAPVELDTKTPERFVTNGKNVRQDSMESEPRIQHAPSFHSGYIPIDFSDEEVAQQWPEPPSAKHFQHRFADSPTLSPARLSSIGSMSSAGSREFEDLEHNPWSSHGAGSPLSSFDGSCSPAKSPYAPSLVPDALAPRRTNSGEHMQRKDAAPKAQNLAESMRQMQLDSQLRNDSTASSGIQPPLYLDDGLSMGNEPDRYQNKSPSMMSTINFVASSNPFEPARNHYQNMPAPTPTRPLPPSSSEQQPQRAPTYSWLPRTSPVPQTSMSNLRARQFQQRQATPPIGELEEPAYRPAPMPQRPQESSYRQMQPTAPMPMSNHRAYQQQATSPPRHSPPRYSPPQQLAIAANVTAYKWDMPNSPPRTAPIPPMRAPERESVLPIPRRDTAHSMAMTSSSGSIVVLPPPPTPGPQSAPVQSSFHLANKRVSTVSSSGSSGSGGPRPPPVPMPALRTIPSSAPPGNAKACMPNEKNKFAGFCKGAWRGQIGDQKKAYEDRSRPAGIGTNKMLNYYKCKKCNFEGRAKRDAKGKSICPDNKVYGSNGILYRWEFLFKSHIESKGTNGSPLDASYGCMFCCAVGRGTPIFAGVASLMNHLQEHRHVLPQGEIIYRMNAIVGRSPDPEEDFDVALPSLVI